MIENLPNWINVVFLIATAFTLVMFYVSNGKPKLLILLFIAWGVLHSYLSFTGFYLNTDAFPPRFTYVILPSTLLVVYGVLPRSRQWVYQNRNLEVSTLLHTVRIAVEIILFYLFVHNMVPELMTFEGRNFDILAGISALIIGFFFLLGKLNDRLLLIWNIIGLGLILFILFTGIFSSELPFQLFAFEQPNRAMTYFPFVLLPAIIVPIVIYTHITDILVLIKRRR